MLYASFRIIAIVTAIFGMVTMIDTDNTNFIILPIMMIVWGCYSLYKQFGGGVKSPNRHSFWGDDSWLCPDSYDSNSSQHPVVRCKPSVTWASSDKPNKKEYQAITKKMKQNLKITIENPNQVWKTEQPRPKTISSPPQS